MPKILPQDKLLKQLVKNRTKCTAAQHKAQGALTTNHLIGSIKYRSEREFHLLADLTDLNWDDKLLQHARVLAGHHKGQVGATRAPANPPPDFVYKSLGSSWTEIGPMLLDITVSEFCQVLARGTWTQAVLPSETLVRQTFMDLLTKLERGTV